MPRPDDRRPPAPYWHRGIGSRAGPEAAHRFLVLIHPSPQLLVGKIPRFGQWRLFLAQAPRDEEQQLRLLSQRQRFDGTFDFGQCLHAAILPPDSPPGNRALTPQSPRSSGAATAGRERRGVFAFAAGGCEAVQISA